MPFTDRMGRSGRIIADYENIYPFYGRPSRGVGSFVYCSPSNRCKFQFVEQSISESQNLPVFDVPPGFRPYSLHSAALVRALIVPWTLPVEHTQRIFVFLGPACKVN